MPNRALLLLACLMALCSGAVAGEGGPIRRPSCTVVRLYVAKFTAPAAEAWARSKGATDAEIELAKRCIKGLPNATETTQWAGQ